MRKDINVRKSILDVRDSINIGSIAEVTETKSNTSSQFPNPTKRVSFESKTFSIPIPMTQFSTKFLPKPPQNPKTPLKHDLFRKFYHRYLPKSSNFPTEILPDPKPPKARSKPRLRTSSRVSVSRGNIFKVYCKNKDMIEDRRFWKRKSVLVTRARAIDRGEKPLEISKQEDVLGKLVKEQSSPKRIHIGKLNTNKLSLEPNDMALKTSRVKYSSRRKSRKTKTTSQKTTSSFNDRKKKEKKKIQEGIQWVRQVSPIKKTDFQKQ